MDVLELRWLYTELDISCGNVYRFPLSQCRCRRCGHVTGRVVGVIEPDHDENHNKDSVQEAAVYQRKHVNSNKKTCTLDKQSTFL